MQDFKKRLVEFARVRYDMGQTRFEEMCGIHPGTISAIKSNGPTASIVTKIAIKCPELNLNWLFRGDGEMLNGEADSSRKNDKSETTEISVVKTAGAVIISDVASLECLIQSAVSKALANG